MTKLKWVGNIILSQCNVVIGDLNTLGNIFESEDLFEILNNKYFRSIMNNLIRGIYPNKACKTCSKYSLEFD